MAALVFFLLLLVRAGRPPQTSIMWLSNGWAMHGALSTHRRSIVNSNVMHTQVVCH